MLLLIVVFQFIIALFLFIAIRQNSVYENQIKSLKEIVYELKTNFETLKNKLNE